MSINAVVRNCVRIRRKRIRWYEGRAPKSIDWQEICHGNLERK